MLRTLCYSAYFHNQHPVIARKFSLNIPQFRGHLSEEQTIKKAVKYIKEAISNEICALTKDARRRHDKIILSNKIKEFQSLI